jgi:hypothetical protein
MGGGCISLNPENFLPKAIALAGNDRRIDGSVNVQAFVPNVSKGKVALFHSGELRVALEKAIAQKGLFQRIEQGDADYVLDVWVTNAKHELKTFGEGYIIDMTSIWRLTRTRDGKAIFCDFADGHGAAHAVGSNAYVKALEASTRDMIQKGLSALSDRPTPFAAMYIAEDWPSMGSVIPEGYKKMRENWSKLRKGLTEKEVREMIPSMPHRSCSANSYFTDQFQERRSEIHFPAKKEKDKEGTVFVPCGWNTQDVTVAFTSLSGHIIIDRILSVEQEVVEPLYPFYALTFVKGVLERWELRN